MEPKQLKQELEETLAGYLFTNFTSNIFLNENESGKTEFCDSVAKDILTLAFLQQH